MSTAALIVIILGVGATAVVAAWMLLNRHHPETENTHEASTEPTTQSDEFYKGADRPAGPDAEPMNPDLLGGDHSRPDR